MSVERASGPRSAGRSCRHAARTPTAATIRTSKPDALTANQARRKRPRPRLTGIHAQAERQIRTAASAVVSEQDRRADEDAGLDQRAAEGAPSSSAVIATAPATSASDREVDVVALEGRRRGLRHGPWREAREARRKGRAGAGLAVEDRHARLPARIVHRSRSVPTARIPCARGAPRRALPGHVVGPRGRPARRVNLVPLVGVLFLGWNVYTLLVLYWAENGIVGALNVAQDPACGGPARTPAGVTIR